MSLLQNLNTVLANPLLNMSLGILGSPRGQWGQGALMGLNNSLGMFGQMQQQKNAATRNKLLESQMQQQQQEQEKRRQLQAAMGSGVGQGILQSGDPQKMAQAFGGMLSPEKALELAMMQNPNELTAWQQAQLNQQNKITPYQSEMLDLRRDEMAAQADARNQLTPYQARSLELREQALGQISPSQQLAQEKLATYQGLTPEERKQEMLKPETMINMPPTSEERKREQQSKLGLPDVDKAEQLLLGEDSVQYPFVPDWLATEKGKQARNALRRAAQKLAYIQTGAAMNMSEAEDYAKNYFPSFGDDEETIRTKIDALRRDLEGYQYGKNLGNQREPMQAEPFSGPEPEWTDLGGGVRARMIP